MLPQPLTELEIWQVHSYIKKMAIASLDANTSQAAQKTDPVNVPFEHIRDARKRPAEWLTYAGDYSGHRHTTLNSITKENVRNLRVEWVAQLRSSGPPFEASPIVHGRWIYVSEPPEGVVAFDADSGELLWRFRRPVPPGISLCCGPRNRGVAILNDAIVFQTLDAHVVSVDAITGKKRWETKLAEYREGYSMTGAPLALRDKLIVGIAGGEFGIRGFISALRASDGHKLWTFHTVPRPGEAGHETWGGDSWKRGGAPTWATGAYDSESDTVYWGVGNPAPLYQGDARPGDNLYSNSVVALDGSTGSLRWHFQFTPSDEHDWDAVQQPVLAEIPWQGKNRSVMLWANRNGFFYVLDRKTGKFLLAKPFVKQIWTSGFEPNGRPIFRAEGRPSRAGTLVWPWSATNWWPPSFDSKRLLLFVPAVDAAAIFFREEPRFEEGKMYEGSSYRVQTDQPVTTAIKGIDVRTGEIRWETVLAKGSWTIHKEIGGILSTSTGVVFFGYRDEFLALDADTGEVLRRIRVGGMINAPPVSYSIGGRQFVAVMAGNALFSFALP
jgi:alcohol dehydrogenase (cytochrome c)